MKKKKEIPFTIIRNGKEYAFETPKQEEPQKKAPGWKTKAAIGLSTLTSIIGGYKARQNNNDIDNTNKTTTTRTPTTNPTIYDATTQLTKEDTLQLKDLSGKRAYVSNKNLSVNKEVLQQTKEAFEGMNLEQIVKVTGLGGLYKKFTGLDSLEHVDYETALKHLWERKKNGKLSKEFFDEANKMVEEYDQRTTKKTNFEEYESFLNNHINNLKENYDLEHMLTKPDGKKVHQEKERFIKNFYEHISGDMALGFSITEIFPSINPELNKIIYDKLLQEAGIEFLMKIPAMGDPYMSFGNFQNSSYTINPKDAGSLNKHLPKEERAPQSMIYHDTKEEHTTSAFLNMLYNTKSIGNVLFNNNQITNFNNLFEQLDEEKQYLLVAGVLSAAHNNPKAAARGLLNYTNQVRQGKESPDSIVSKFQAPGVQPYYTQSIENNLILNQK